jgi:hypothetical protein
MKDINTIEAPKAETVHPREGIYSDLPLTSHNVEQASELCPDGYQLKYWLNEYINQKLREDLGLESVPVEMSKTSR